MQGMEELRCSGCLGSPLATEPWRSCGTGMERGSGVRAMMRSMEKASGLGVLIMLLLADRLSLDGGVARILVAVWLPLLSMAELHLFSRFEPLW